MNPNIEVLLSQGEGESWWVLGDLYTFKATGKQTNGTCTVIEQIIEPQSGPPPHIHHREDEAFYVLEGKFSFLCGEKKEVFGAGSFVYIPKGSLHTFQNIAEQPGRLLVIITPAGLEEFFYAIGVPARDLVTAPVFDPTLMDKLIQLADQYHLEIILPERT